MNIDDWNEALEKKGIAGGFAAVKIDLMRASKEEDDNFEYKPIDLDTAKEAKKDVRRRMSA